MKDLLLVNLDYQILFVYGLWVMVKLFVISWILVMLLVVLLIVVCSISSWLVQVLVVLFVEYYCNVLGLVQIFVWYFGVLQLLLSELQCWINYYDGEFFFLCIVFMFYVVVYMSEDLCSGLCLLLCGQVEVVCLLGMLYCQMLQYILLLQVLCVVLLLLVNQILVLFKVISLVMIVGVVDVMYVMCQIENEIYCIFEVFLMVLVVYVLLLWFIMGVGVYVSCCFSSVRN